MAAPVSALAEEAKLASRVWTQLSPGHDERPGELCLPFSREHLLSDENSYTSLVCIQDSPPYILNKS